LADARRKYRVAVLSNHYAYDLSGIQQKSSVLFWDLDFTDLGKKIERKKRAKK
jgi:hypothetical protein